jgi:hypothetical protein
VEWTSAQSLEKDSIAMKLLLTTAAFALAAVPVIAQDQATGTSTPPPAIITATPDEVPMPAQRVKPSAAVAYAPGSQTAPSAFGPYVPYTPPGATAQGAAPRDPDAEIVTSVPTHREADEDAGIVTYVPSRPNEVPEGTLLQTRINETLSTTETRVGARFTAEVTAPMERDGRVIVPVGSVIHGRVTLVRGGRRISGAAAIHLLTESVTLPDGTHYILHAQVIDTSQHNVTRVNEEGTILRRDHVKGTIAAMSLTTGGAAAAGAMIGGVPGAFVGAGIGAGVSTVWWLKQDRQEVIPQNTLITFSLSLPMSITPLTMGTE